MARSMLVTPDLQAKELDIELSEAADVLGG